MSVNTDAQVPARSRWAALGVPLILVAGLAAAYAAFWVLAEFFEAREALSKSAAIFGSAFAYATTGQPLEITSASNLPLAFTVTRTFALGMLVVSALSRFLLHLNNHHWLDSTAQARKVMHVISRLCLWTAGLLTMIAFVAVLA